MDYESKIKELTDRIEKLEKAENKRILKRKIKITWTIIKVVSIIVILLVSYFYVYSKVIKPYQERIDYIEDKVGKVESYVQEKWDLLKKYTPFVK